MKKRERDLIISSLRKSGLSLSDLETADYMGEVWCMGNIFKAVRQCLGLGDTLPKLKKATILSMTHWCIYLLYIINKEEKLNAKRKLTDSESV